MPEEVYGARYRFLPRPEILSFEEIERLVRLFVRLGVRKLRLTGGEPLLRHDLPKLVEKLAAIPGIQDLALTTNGHLLSRHAPALAEAGLRRVTVSLDSHDAEVFQRMSGGRSEPGRVLAGIKSAERAGLGPVKVNCVVQRGVNDDKILELARLFHGTDRILRFIEFMDVGTRNAWDLGQVVPAAELVERIDAALPLEPVGPNYPGEVARRYRYRYGGGEVGMIASVTQPFCGGCTRARLSAAGALLTCLFAAGGYDLKAPLRSGASDEMLLATLQGIWQQRRDRYSEQRAAPSGRPSERVEMYQIGG